MDNCDLDNLSMSEGKLMPSFRPDVTQYKATVESSVKTTTLHLQTSDSAATYRILSGDGSGTVSLEDGLNRLEVEVVSEDGSSQIYCIEVMKVSSAAADLSDLSLGDGHTLQPDFCPSTLLYCCCVPFDCSEVTVTPQTPDSSMRVSVNDDDSCSRPVLLNAGETAVLTHVTSADGTNSQVYTVNITREQIPLAVTFCDVTDQIEFECPVSLSALYKPVSVQQSKPKRAFSAPFIEMLTRRSKVDTFTESPLGEGWKVQEPELEKRLSDARVKCFFCHRGCSEQMRYAEIGAHAKECPHKPSSDLHSEEVTEANWYKKYLASSSNLETTSKHTLEIRNWEERLQTIFGEHDVDDLIAHAEEQLKLYRKCLPNPGHVMRCDSGRSPLDHLKQAAVQFATAVKIKPNDAELHFLLGQTLEEHYYATEMFGWKKEVVEDEKDESQAKSSGKHEEILAICRIHGFPGTPSLENQLKALDMELQELKQQGQSAKADYVQTLFLWRSKQAGKKDGSDAVSEDKCWLHRALLKYLDAGSLRADGWEFNLHAGRLLLREGRVREALPHLQTALRLSPGRPIARFYAGLALLQQTDASEVDQQNIVLLLQQGLEYVMGQILLPQDHKERDECGPGCHLSVVNAQFLRGCLSLAALLTKGSSSAQAMSPEQVYHIVAGLAAQGILRCVSPGEELQQLEQVLLDAHFALLHGLVQQERKGKRLWIMKRCQALSALIRLSSLAPCRELLELQEKVCQMAVVAVPRCSAALCGLGWAQLALSDADEAAEGGHVALTDACLSFQASIALEGSCQTGEAPEQLNKQSWWKDHLAAEKGTTVKREAPETKPAVDSSADGKKTARAAPATAKSPAKTSRIPAKATAGAARGRAGGASVAKNNGAVKTVGKASVKAQPPPCKPKPEPNTPEETPHTSAVEADPEDSELRNSLNEPSYRSRLGLARALGRSADSHTQARQLYQDVIDMAPEVYEAYMELAELLKDEPLAAVDVYSRFPLKPVHEQTFDNAFITGEIVRILMKHELYEHPLLMPSLTAHGRVMGLGCLEKYIEVLEGKFMTSLLRAVYAGIHERPVDDEELQDFFRFKCWI